MIIGVPKEIKNNENRVALTPAGAFEFTKRKHKVYIQSTAGNGSGFSDEDYTNAGADMIMKVKEPIAEEYDLVKDDQLLFTYFHFASYEPLTHAMIKSNAVCLAYETVENPDGSKKEPNI